MFLRVVGGLPQEPEDAAIVELDARERADAHEEEDAIKDALGHQLERGGEHERQEQQHVDGEVRHALLDDARDAARLAAALEGHVLAR